jgi:uncharacterized protein
VGGAALSGRAQPAGGAPAPWAFLLGTLAWTWTLIGLAALTGRSLADPVGALLLLAGGVGPVVIACLLIALGCWDHRLDAGPGAFLRRCFDPRTLPARHYLVVLGLIGVIALLPALLDRSADWRTFAAGPAAFLLIGAVFGALEEPGWRGYAQEALQRRLPVVVASLVIGVFWALWHLPLFFVAGTYQAGLGVGTPAFWAFFAALVIGSPIYAWLYNVARGVVFAAVMYHAGGNVARELLPDAAVGHAVGVEAVLAAILVVIAWRWMRISRPSGFADSSAGRSCR